MSARQPKAATPMAIEEAAEMFVAITLAHARNTGRPNAYAKALDRLESAAEETREQVLGQKNVVRLGAIRAGATVEQLTAQEQAFHDAATAILEAVTRLRRGNPYR